MTNCSTTAYFALDMNKISVGKYEFKLLRKIRPIRLTRNQILSTLKFLNLNFTVARKDTMLAIRVEAMMAIAIAVMIVVTIFKRRIMAKIAATFLKEIAVTLSITRFPWCCSERACKNAMQYTR